MGLDQHLGTGDFFEAPKLLAEIGTPNGMMKDSVGAKIIRVWSTHEANDGQILTVRTSYGVDDT